MINKNSMRTLLIWLSGFMIPFGMNAQEWAGPDVDVCEKGTPKTLGSSDPCVDCCYNWTPVDNLSCTTCKNPTITSDKSGEYTVEVRDKFLRLIGTDKVMVNAAFANIHVTPGFMIQGSGEPVVGELLTLAPNFSENDVAWDWIGESLGCMREPDGKMVTVTPGTQYGTVTLKAVYIGDYDGECWAEKEIDVNNGVKDVWATDANSPTRTAKNGQTLVLLNEPVVKISAKPNEGGFRDGIPDWKPDAYGTHTPSPGARDFETSETPQILDGRTSQYIAGELPDGQPKVTVIRKIPLPPLPIPLSIPGMDTLDKLIKKHFKFPEADEIEPPCGTLSPFSVSLSMPALEYKIQEAEKYNSPATGNKTTFKLEASVSATGKVFHPAATKTFSVKAFGVDIFLCSRLYAELKGTLTVNMEFIKDDSLQDNSWNAGNPSLSAALDIGGMLQFIFVPPGYLISASAGIFGKFDNVFTYEDETNRLTHLLKIDPVTAKCEAKIQQEGDMGKYEDVLGGILNISKSFTLFEGKNIGPSTLHQF
jgi:hypothetical protein